MPKGMALPKIDSALRTKCAEPITLPERSINQREVEKFWSVDRKNLSVCSKRLALLNEAITFRDAQYGDKKD